MRIGIFGKGRLAAAIVAELGKHPYLNLAWQVDETGQPTPVDVAIDASVADAVEGHLDWALANTVDFVIGATGWSLPNLEAKVASKIGVLVAPNFSMAVALMQRLSLVLGRFANLDPEADPFLIEHHHNKKTDAPSGTAKALAQAVLDGCERKVEYKVGVVAPNQLSVAVVRAGHEFGAHTVGIDAPGEVLEISHRARSRAIFGSGALQAAMWIHGKKGVHTFSELADEVLTPLFRIEK